MHNSKSKQHSPANCQAENGGAKCCAMLVAFTVELTCHEERERAEKAGVLAGDVCYDVVHVKDRLACEVDGTHECQHRYSDQSNCFNFHLMTPNVLGNGRAAFRRVRIDRRVGRLYGERANCYAVDEGEIAQARRLV